jgi:hypothetical protein
VVELRQKLAQTEAHLELARSAVLKAVEMSHRRNRGLLERAITGIPEDMLKRPRALCHPDRWQGTPQLPMATAIMQWLNGGGR